MPKFDTLPATPIEEVSHEPKDVAALRVLAPVAFASFVRGEIAKWARVIREARLEKLD